MSCYNNYYHGKWISDTYLSNANRTYFIITTTSRTVNDRTWSGRANRSSYRTPVQFLDWRSVWTTSQNRIDLSFIESSPTPNAIEIQPGIENSCHETLIVKKNIMCGVIVIITSIV